LVKDFGPGVGVLVWLWGKESGDERTCGGPDEDVRLDAFDDREEIMAFSAFPFGVVTCVSDLCMHEFVVMGF
jgi:hypothetical protein